MKKFLFILLSMLIFTGCNSKIPENSENPEVSESASETAAATSEAVSITTSETVTETAAETTESAQPVYTELSENIRVYDLRLSENSELIPEEKIIYSRDVEMPDYGVISNADGKISLIANDGTEKLLTESPYPDDSLSWVLRECVIDDNRFAYSIANEWVILGFGVYDLDKMEDRQIISPEDFGYSPKAVCGNSLVLSKTDYFDFRGFAKCDLETFEIADIALPIDYESMNIRLIATSDKSLAAVLSIERTDDDRKSEEYTVTVMSLDKCEIIGEFTFERDNGCGNMDMEFVSENELRLYAKRNEDGVYNLYVFNF